MQKIKLNPGCLGAITIWLLVFLGCSGFIFIQARNFAHTSTILAEEIIETKLPPGFIAQGAKSVKRSYEGGKHPAKAVELIHGKNHTIFIVQVRPMSEKNIQQYLKSFQTRQNQTYSTYKLIEKGYIKLNSASYPKYLFRRTLWNGSKEHALVTFIKYPEKTLILTYYSKPDLYDEEIPEKLVNAINKKLQKINKPE